MDTSGPGELVIFDSVDHPLAASVIFVEHRDGYISVIQSGQEDRMYSRLGFLLEYMKWADSIKLEDGYNKTVDKFFREYYTEAEWTLAALSIS